MAMQGVELVMPLPVQDRMIGAILLGPRKSGLPYGTSERELLGTLALQTAAALLNAALVASNAELSRAYRTLQDTQTQLLQSEKMASLGQLVAGVAHEINTPVTSVVGNVGPLLRELERLREHAGTTGDASLDRVVGRMRAIAEVMARGAERTAGIVQDLRVFSRVEEARPLPMDVHEGIDVCLRLLRPRWADRIEIHRNYGEVPPVDAVASQINQVLMNLLANACDAIEGRGNIWIATRSDGDRVVLTVRDDGCGMPPDVQAKVFDPFFTTKPLGKGMGLGLAICTGIVGSHAGTIDVASEPGRGTTFTVTLPLRMRPR
jgi:two-component system NtrC family sensor kinase